MSSLSFKKSYCIIVSGKINIQQHELAMSIPSITFYDHEVVQKAPNDYIEIILSPQKILSAWAISLFAHELLNPDGTIKPQKAMNANTLHKFIEISDDMKRGEIIPKPVIGIGIMDNLEIGIGREIIVLAAQNNIQKIPVHVRKAQSREIEKLLNV